jgi:murein DD-endopeptidase MepM/ murein hydrolase activator NlpD
MVKRTLLLLTLSGLFMACSGVQVRHSENATEAEAESESALNDWQSNQQRSYFDWPVDDARMTRGFLPNRRRPHKGIDLAAHKNTPIMASHDGTVIYTGRGFRGFGRMIMIEGEQGWATLYGHLNKIKVHEGQRVRQGEIIGAMGSTGRSTGVHLHFEIRKLSGPVDPLPYLPGGTRLAHN